MSNVEGIQNEMTGLKIAQETDERNSPRREENITTQDNSQRAGKDGETDVDADYDADTETKGKSHDVDAEKEEKGEVEQEDSPELQWEALLQLITMRIDEAIKRAGIVDKENTWTTAEHNAHYRGTFEALREEVASRDDIPDAIATPPGIHLLRLVFCPARLAGQCPCCLDGGYEFPQAVVGVSNDHEFPEVGVTKDIFLQGLRDGLFPEVKEEEGGKSEERENSMGAEVKGGEEGEGGKEDDNRVELPAEKVTLLTFCWMNNDGGLVDDTLYVYYSTPDDDASSTRSKSAMEEVEQGEPADDDEAKDEESGTKEE